MLGFSASNGVEIKGRYARKMRAQEQPKVTLVREY